jgi:hypothetical protein
MSDKKVWSCSSIAILLGIVIAPVIAVAIFMAPRSVQTVHLGNAIPIYVPHHNPIASQGSVTVLMPGLKERIPKAFAEGNEQVEGIAVVWSYEFQTTTPLFGKKTLRTFYKAYKIPLDEFHENIDRDNGLEIPIPSETFSLSSRNGEDVIIVPAGWDTSDSRGLYIERIGNFTRLIVTATVCIGTYHAESEFSTVISADPLPDEYERQFVMSSPREIILPNFSR